MFECSLLCPVSNLLSHCGDSILSNSNRFQSINKLSESITIERLGVDAYIP